jgi:UDP-N-acetylmuramyl pentapeptide phosphotransferase/UDP-N-acetylglucosamine-1-phosphate transferase
MPPLAISPFAALAIVFGAGAISIVLIVILRPLLMRYAQALPNARSSHKTPTPQGGGIAVISATLVVTGFAAGFSPTLAAICLAAILLALLGAADDIRPLDVLPRLLGQTLAVALILAILPAGLTITSFLPWWLERALLLVAGLWFVNLVNFMDGIDWITISEMLPVTGALALFAAAGHLPLHGFILALALFGALLGFAPFNRPVARLFLGDVGSLPIGLLVGYLLLLLAGAGYVAAAFLLPLYYLMDATLTLLRRLWNGEKFWQAHRSHFYQRARDRGFSVMQIVVRIFALNLALALLAAASIRQPGFATQSVALALGILLTGGLLKHFSRKRPAGI